MTRLLIPLFLILNFSATASELDEHGLPYVEIKQAHDFSLLGEEARREGRIIMLEISGTDCAYCEQLEEDFIKPMLRNGDYGHVIIRKLDRDSSVSVTDFSGRKTTPADFAYRYKVSLTPTLLFLDGRGREIASRIIGYNTPELFGGYLDAALETGMEKLRAR